MEGIYSWVLNIVGYLIFVTMITSLLPAGKYEKYLRLFSGCILILLVLKPLTGGLRLEENINAIFRSVSFENEAEELRGQLDEMEQKRLNHLISRYEQAASEELVRLAEEEGFQAQSVSVSINGDSQSQDFGKVNKIEMALVSEQSVGLDGVEQEQGQEQDQMAAEEPESSKGIEPIHIDEVEEIQIGREAEEPSSDRAAEAAGPATAVTGTQTAPQTGTAAIGRQLQSFRQTVAGYYQMEEENVEIRVEN